MAEVVKLKGVEINGDGTAATIDGVDRWGKSQAMTFRADELHLVIAALSQAEDHAAGIRHRTPDEKKELPVEWWSIDPHPSGDGLLVSWRMHGGMGMTFYLRREPALQFADLLVALLDLKTPPQIPVRKH